MVTLPKAIHLPIENLAASFDNVTNSYKFYWFLAILEDIRENQSRILSKDNLLARMVASVWFPINYFRLSFGKQDRLGNIAVKIGSYAKLAANATHQDVISVATQIDRNDPLYSEMQTLGKYAPYRFLRPFFSQQLRGLEDWKVNQAIAELASESFISSNNPCPYRFLGQFSPSIEIHPDWFDYLNRHLSILMGFCLWHLINYIQKNNPNIPNIPRKLFEPGQRDLSRARVFWNLAFDHLGDLQCIYSGQVIRKDNYSLDHFLPWRFVAHDLLWNLIPAPKPVNSAKSDFLPNLQCYFTSFAKLQYDALQAVVNRQNSKLVEDYIQLLNVSSIPEIRGISVREFQQTLYNTIAPQFQIAANMGFATQWIYPGRC
jgi:hypothetical protein